jgi:hypothetical protein
MPTIAVFPEDPTAATPQYIATCDGKDFIAPTVGQALDGLTEQIGPPTETTLVIIQPFKPDRFFTAEQIARLSALKAEWRSALDTGTRLPDGEQRELDSLIEAQLTGTIERTKALIAASKS